MAFQSTFLTYPETLLGRMLSGESTLGVFKQPDGSLFFDRSSDYFEYVLNFYRLGPEMELPVENDVRMRALYSEFQFWCIDPWWSINEHVTWRSRLLSVARIRPIEEEIQKFVEIFTTSEYLLEFVRQRKDTVLDICFSKYDISTSEILKDFSEDQTIPFLSSVKLFEHSSPLVKDEIQKFVNRYPTLMKADAVLTNDNVFSIRKDGVKRLMSNERVKQALKKEYFFITCVNRMIDDMEYANQVKIEFGKESVKAVFYRNLSYPPPISLWPKIQYSESLPPEIIPFLGPKPTGAHHVNPRNLYKLRLSW